MKRYDQLYINGEWCKAATPVFKDIVNPATEAVIGEVVMASKADVDLAVAAAKNAFESWSQTTVAERLAVIDRILVAYKNRMEDIAQAITAEMGAPIGLSRSSQAPVGYVHFKTARKALEQFEFEETVGTTLVAKEAVGVCALITPWNWPMNQITCKVVPALACGCTVILKPSENAALSAQIFAEIMHEAQVPAGVFNMVTGDGVNVGAALSQHHDVDMVSLTGSTRAGKQVTELAANTIKRVALELGGKSACIVLDDADVAKAVKRAVRSCFQNTGQSCNAPTRLLVPRTVHDEAVDIAVACAQATHTGDPLDESIRMGPVSNATQFERVNAMIATAIAEGAELVSGGEGRPNALSSGYFVKPTVFANVDNAMTIAQEEVFGPVIVIIPYDDEEQAVSIANDSVYGLAAYIETSNLERARRISRQLRVGSVYINGNNFDVNAPFGGFKQSGNGREYGKYGFDEFLETKAILGFSESE